MTITATRPGPRTTTRPAVPPLPGWPLPAFLLVTGALMAAAGVALLGNLQWIKSDGLLGGGIALVVAAPFARSLLDPLVVSTPFMFYTLSPVGGILTVGSSDLLLPVVVAVLVVGAVVVPRRLRPSYPPVRGASWQLLAALLVVTGSTTWWAIASPDFLLARAIADAVKLGIGVLYLVLTVVLVRRAGVPGALRAFRLWAWAATALALGSLAGVTGAVELIPSDGYRSLGYFEDANLYAGFLLVSLSVVLFLSTVAPSVTQPVQAVLIVGGIVMTGSRGGLVSLAVLVAFVALVVNSLRVRVALLALSAASTAGLLWLLAHRDSGTTVLGLDRLFDASQDVGDDPRLALWGRAVEKWLDAPVWGIGLGQFERYSGDIFRVARSTGLGYVTHNSFLFFLVSFGVIGLGLFLWFLGWLLVHLYRTAWLSRPAKHALASGMLVILSQMMTLNLQNLRYVWVYFGLVLGVSLLRPPEEDRA